MELNVDNPYDKLIAEFLNFWCVDLKACSTLNECVKLLTLMQIGMLIPLVIGELVNQCMSVRFLQILELCLVRSCLVGFTPLFAQCKST